MNILHMVSISLLSGSILQALQEIFRRNSTMRTFHALMINLAAMINNIETIEKIVPQECYAIHSSLRMWRDFLNPQSPNYCSDLHNAVEILKSNNFTGVPSANIGTSFRQLVNAYEYVLRSQDKLVTLLNIYGNIDASMSVAKLYKESEQQGRFLSWASFDEHTYPFHSLEDIYNPLVPFENIALNSFTLGGDAVARHMLLNGPHGCGKTTSMKSIVYAYIMGQSILLVTAKKATFAPITQLGVYLNVTDNLAAGTSSFMAEKKFMQQLEAMAHNLTPSDRCLMIIDEPYAKTLQEIGEKRAYTFLNELRNIPQLMMLFASHFAQPIRVEEESKGQVKNYYPELLEPTPGNFIRTFKIIEGTATWWLTSDVDKRERFITWLSEVGG